MHIFACVGIGGSLFVTLLPASVSIGGLFIIALGCSLILPAICPLAMSDLGRFTKAGGAFITSTIIGGAVLPTLFGFLVDVVGPQSAYWIILPSFLFILYYGVNGYKIRIRRKAYGKYIQQVLMIIKPVSH